MKINLNKLNTTLYWNTKREAFAALEDCGIEIDMEHNFEMTKSDGSILFEGQNHLVQVSWNETPTGRFEFIAYNAN